MKTFLVSEDEQFARTIRQLMIREGVDCSVSSVVSFGQAARRLASEPEPADLIVAVLPDDPALSLEALDLLATVPRSERTQVIAVGPAADAKLVIRALRGVDDDYVDMNDLEPELVAALVGWRRKWAQDRPEGRVVAILGPSGGAGSSTIAASLSVQIARDHKTVGLLDLKLVTGDLAALLDLKPDYSIADLSKNVDRLDQVFFQRALMPHACGVHLLSAPRRPTDSGMVTAEGVRQAINLSKAAFPFVVVDVDHTFGDEQVQALRQAEVILMVFRLDFSSLKNVTKFLEHLDGLGVPTNRVRLVVNRAGQPQEVPIAKVEEALNSKVFHSIPDDPKIVNRANNNGMPVILDSPSSRFSRGVARLAELIYALQPEAGAAKGAPADPPGRTRQPTGASTILGASLRPNPALQPARGRVGEWRS